MSLAQVGQKVRLSRKAQQLNSAQGLILPKAKRGIREAQVADKICTYSAG